MRIALDELERALLEHATFMLGEHLRHIDEVDASITRVTQEIGRCLSLPDPPPEGEQSTGQVSETPPVETSEAEYVPSQAPVDWQEAVTLLNSIPGINERAAHSILVIIYHVLSEHMGYRELGSNFFDERDRQVTEKRLVRRLEGLGYHVELPVEQTAS